MNKNKHKPSFLHYNIITLQKAQQQMESANIQPKTICIISDEEDQKSVPQNNKWKQNFQNQMVDYMNIEEYCGMIMSQQVKDKKDAINEKQNSGGIDEEDMKRRQREVEEFNLLEKKGKMVRILKQGDNEGQFVVEQCLNGLKCQLMKKKQQIVKNSISILLNYYEQKLGFVDQPHNQSP